MKEPGIRGRKWLVIALAVALLAPVPAHAQEGPVRLASVEPGEGRPGQELELTLRGSGFEGQATVHVGELPVWEVVVESDRVIRARISVPEDAKPGPRPVEVVIDMGGPQETFRSTLEGGFTVLEPQPDGGDGEEGYRREEEHRGEGEYDYEDETDLSWLLWVVALAGLIVIGGTAALAVALLLRRRQSALRRERQSQWQSRAREIPEKELPRECQPGSVFVRREQPEITPGRWRISDLTATLYDAAGGSVERGGEHAAPSKLVARIDRAAREMLLRGDEKRLEARATELGRELAGWIVGLQARSRDGRDLMLEPTIQGGSASVEFTLYRCVGEPGQWRKEREWEAEIDALKRAPISFHGPQAGETAEEYRAYLEERITAYLRDLLHEMGRLV